MAQAPATLPNYPRPAVPAETVEALALLFSALHQMPAVRRLMLSRGDGSLDLWVAIPTESDEIEDAIYAIERDCRRMAGTLPLELHIVPLDRTPEEALPRDVLLLRG